MALLNRLAKPKIFLAVEGDVSMDVKNPLNLSSRWPKHGNSPLSAVAPGTAGVNLLVPSGLSYYPTPY